jgi:putative transposase
VSFASADDDVLPIIHAIVNLARQMETRDGQGRFTEDQIRDVLREHEAGVKAADLCRKHGISNAAFYSWNSKYQRADGIRRRAARALEEENRRLKKLLAVSMLDVSALKDLLGKN